MERYSFQLYAIATLLDARTRDVSVNKYDMLLTSVMGGICLKKNEGKRKKEERKSSGKLYCIK